MVSKIWTRGHFATEINFCGATSVVNLSFGILAIVLLEGESNRLEIVDCLYKDGDETKI